MSTDQYSLLRDFNASTRLTGLHHLWKDCLGFTIHPDIQSPPGARIADAATGNGVWLLDVARTLDDCMTQFDGFDISLDQCPSKLELPPNCRFHIGDIFEAPDEAFAETIDMVYIRLLTIVLKNNDPTPCSKMFASCLVCPCVPQRKCCSSFM